MTLATETRELTNLKTDIIHKIFLAGQLQLKGFDKASQNRPAEDVVYLSSILETDLKAVRAQLEQELFNL